MPSIQDYYRDRWASLEHQAPAPEANETFGLRVGAALRAVGEPPKRVLDFGCAYGNAARLFAEAGHQVVGVDISEPAIKAARATVPAVTFELIDSETQLPFQDASFDVCFCSETIEHLFDIRGFIREMHRLPTVDGLFVITTPYHGWLKNLLIITLSFDRHFSPTSGHIRFFTRSSVTSCLEAGGFRVECVSGIGRFWPIWKSMFVIARKLAQPAPQ